VVSVALLGAAFGVSSAEAQSGGVEAPSAIVTPAPAPDSVVVFDSLSDLAQRLRADTHVYIHRSVNLNPNRLAEFERELDTKHPNWFVVIIEDASSLRHSQGGVQYTGVDAVDSFTDTALRQSNAFSGFKDSVTNLPNGAYFVVAKNGSDRAMFYSGMEHYDRFVTKEQFQSGSVGEAAYKVLKADPFGYFEAARAAIGSVEGAVASAEQWGAVRPFVYGGGLLGVLGVAGGIAHLRSRNRRKSAEETLQNVERALKEKSEAFIELTGTVRDIFGSVIPTFTHYEGETLEKAKALATSMRALFTFQQEADKIVTEARSLIHNGGAIKGNLTTTNFTDAVALLTTTKKKFDPESDLKEQMSGEKLGFDKALIADVKAFAPWEYSLTDILKRYGEEAAKALAIVNSVAQSRDTALAGATKLEAELTQILESFPADAAGNRKNSLFVMKSLAPATLTEFQAAVGDLTPRAVSDPIRAAAAAANLGDRLSVLLELGDEATKLSDSKKAVDEFRTTVGKGLGIESKTVAVEENGDPSTHLRTAEGLLQQVDKELAEGKVSEAKVTLEKAKESVGKGDAVLADARSIVDSFDTLRAAHDEALANRKASIPQVAAVLHEITERYSPTVLRLGAGDPTHPRGDTTIANNISEATTALADAKRCNDQAIAHYQSGRLLAARSSWQAADALYETVDNRLAEVTEKRERISTAEAEGERQYVRLERSCQELVLNSERPETSRGTVEQMRDYVERFEAIREKRAASRTDPIELHEILTDFAERTTALGNQIARDWKTHAEATRSVQAVAEALQAFRQEDTRVRTDEFTDSPTVIDNRRRLPEFTENLAVCQRDLGYAHADAAAIDARADKIFELITAARRALKNEESTSREAATSISAAQVAIGELRSTAREVANDPRRFYGVSISDGAGRAELEGARAAHLRGDHEEADQLADKAAAAATRVRTAFLKDVDERRRAEERRIQQERKDREDREARRAADNLAVAAGVTAAILNAGSSSRSSSFGGGSSRSSGGSRPSSPSPSPTSSRPSTSNARRNF
jgi:tetratricopeptide (TPR) repeat protein